MRRWVRLHNTHKPSPDALTVAPSVHIASFVGYREERLFRFVVPTDPFYVRDFVREIALRISTAAEDDVPLVQILAVLDGLENAEVLAVHKWV